jgi:hypothetical protein
MKTALPAIAAALLFACGPNTASINSPMEGETELDESASTTGELVSNRAEVWFPMQEGNTWSLESAAGETRTVSYEGVYDGIGFLNGLMLDGRWMGTAHNAPNSLYSWSEYTNTWDTFIRFGYANTEWSWGTGACGAFTVKRSASNITVTTPAGKFTNARTIAFQMKPSPTARCMAPAFTELTFAPGVGLIAINTYNGKFLLKSATVAGKAIPAAVVTGIKGSLRLDKSTYVNVPNTIVCITTPCPGNDVTATAKATYTVSNNGTKSETFQFNSGCQFDIKLVDDTGKIVRSLSENRFCTLALTAFTLAPGQAKVFTADLPLSNRIGEQLFGNFTATASLNPSNAVSKAESAASFIVTK